MAGVRREAGWDQERSPQARTTAARPGSTYRYFLLCVNYFFYGETVTDYFFTLVQREEPLRILSKYHRFISFTLYLTGGPLVCHVPL